jgi:hypothetical protein
MLLSTRTACPSSSRSARTPGTSGPRTSATAAAPRRRERGVSAAGERRPAAGRDPAPALAHPCCSRAAPRSAAADDGGSTRPDSWPEWPHGRRRGPASARARAAPAPRSRPPRRRRSSSAPSIRPSSAPALAGERGDQDDPLGPGPRPPGDRHRRRRPRAPPVRAAARPALPLTFSVLPGARLRPRRPAAPARRPAPLPGDLAAPAHVSPQTPPRCSRARSRAKPSSASATPPRLLRGPTGRPRPGARAVGVNNHMGSRLTAERAAMDALMPELHARGPVLPRLADDHI